MIIMVSGKAQAGKDTFYNIVKDLYGKKYKIERVAFADEIKKFAAKKFDWNGIKDTKGRELLISIGTAGRNYNKDIWVIKAINKIMKMPQRTIVIITDFRYTNEYDYIRDAFSTDVITIRVNRNGYNNNLPIEHSTNHSETELDNFLFDYKIENYDLYQYEESIKEVMSEILND